MANERLRKLLKKIYKRYIIVVYNESNLKERISISLTPMNLILILSTLIVTGFILSSLLFIFTPIKETIPAFNNSGSISPIEYRRLQLRVDSLEHTLEQQKKVEESLRKILRGDSDSESGLYLAPPIPKMKSQNMQQAGLFQFASYNEAGDEAAQQTTGNQRTQPRLFFPPTTGYVSKGFDPASEHYAIDIVTQKDAPVSAVKDGYVIFSEWSVTTGNVIILQHDNDLISVYKHNSVLLKKVGSFVRAGEVIALVGNSGEYTTGPHLHFELWSAGNPLDPQNLIAF